jgi:hypothetical protein
MAASCAASIESSPSTVAELLLVLGLGARFSYFYFFFIAASVSAFKLKR